MQSLEKYLHKNNRLFIFVDDPHKYQAADKKTLVLQYQIQKTDTYAGLKFEHKKIFQSNQVNNPNHLCSNYILYNTYVKLQGLSPVFLKNEQEMKSWSSASLQQITNFIFQYGYPDIVFYETLDRPESIIWNYIKQVPLKIEARFNSFGPFGYYPATGFARKNPILDKILKNNKKSSRKSRKSVNLIFKTRNASQYSKWHDRFVKKFNIKTILRNLFYLHKKYKYFFLIIFNIITCKNIFHYKIYTKNNYVYFLNHLPEASSFSESPHNSNPLDIITRLCLHKPCDANIYIKEHPRSYMRRPLGFYEKINRLPGVKLIHPKASNSDLFRTASAVMTVTGTPAFEAGMWNIPAGVLGRPAWSKAPWITELKKPEQIFSLKKFPTNFGLKSKNFYAKWLDSVFCMTKSEINKKGPLLHGKYLAKLILNTYKKIVLNRHQKNNKS